MSLRPRFAGEGRLEIPEWVTIARSGRNAGHVRGGFVSAEIDPFERDADGLLLAEAFARFDFSRPRKSRDWFLAHGAVNLGSLFPDDTLGGEELIEGFQWFDDPPEEIAEQQRIVSWHLTSLARLTEHRDRAQPPAPDWRAHEGWDRRWSMAILEAHDEALWIGAPSSARGRITSEMQRYARFGDVPGRRDLEDYNLEGMSRRYFVEEWWPQAHEAWVRIIAEGLPRLGVPRSGWSEYWQDYDFDSLPPRGRYRYGRLSTDWHGLLELQRRLIEPYVQRAAAFVVEVDRDSRGWLNPGPSGLPEEVHHPELVIREHRRWRSILAPIYLQLLEALRRVSEGKPGAVRCKECGQPFLTLDARRSTFCTDRERLRYVQRDRRERLAKTGGEA